MENELQEEFNTEAMTPEDFQELKRLMEKQKTWKKGLAETKSTLFEKVIGTFGSRIQSCSKDSVTISMGKEQYEDGNIYSATLSVVKEEEEDAEKPASLVKEIIDAHLNEFEQIMGINDSLNLKGTFEGIELNFQIRKR